MSGGANNVSRVAAQAYEAFLNETTGNNDTNPSNDGLPEDLSALFDRLEEMHAPIEKLTTSLEERNQALDEEGKRLQAALEEKKRAYEEAQARAEASRTLDENGVNRRATNDRRTETRAEDSRVAETVVAENKPVSWTA